MNPAIGTHYITQSPEGIYLDSLSIARIRRRALGEMFTIGRAIQDPDKPRSNTSESLRHYRAIIEKNNTRRALKDKAANEFGNMLFSLRFVDTVVNGRSVGSDERLFAHLRRNSGAEILADVITGSLFDENGACLSSDRLFVRGAGREPTLAERTEYIKSRSLRED